MRLCSASDLQEEEDQFSNLQAQILTSSGNSFDLSQPLMLSGPVFSSCWLNTATCFACGKPRHWHSC